MTPTKSTRDVHVFKVLVNYCRDMWYIRSHLLHTLTELTSPKVKFKWNDVEQKAFDDIKRTVAHNTLLAYPDFNNFFDIHTDDSDYKLGAVISQDDKPIALYSLKLTKNQI